MRGKVQGLGWGVFVGLVLAVWPGLATAAELGQAVEPEGVRIWPALLPLLAASTGIERAIEMGWNYLEWGLMRFVGWRPSDLKAASYLEFKSGTSLLAGLFLGVVISNYSGMRLLDYLRPVVPGFLDQIPDLWDILVTGLIIGAGSKPAHDILGIITQLKNFTGNSALRQREQAGAALAEGIVKLGQVDAPPVRVDVPGMGAAPVPGGGPAQAARSRMIDETGRAPRERTIDRYAKAIHDNLYIGS